MKQYRIINNSLGWLMFTIAAITYLLTLEPTASFWDCPEFISQGYKLEIGHPPGNPIFMLAARFFVNFAPDIQHVAIAVNTMSALLSAGTILLLFWTITHLVKRLIIKDDADRISLSKLLVIFGSGICGSLVYTWSDTFWFSAVEGEVYAFSSFCTALVFWLILKWENRADEPHSDRYLILIAYIIGISIAVHLLNLLCIPAIVLVFYYKKFKNTDGKGSLIALGVSVIIVALILYGLVPGFIEMAQYCELLCVNTLGMSYNGGVVVYAILAFGSMIWAIYELYQQQNDLRIKISVLLSIILSGIPFIGDSWLIPTIIIAGLIYYLFIYAKTLPIRIINITILSIFVIFIGYSSYALLLIRSSANTPMNQNAPDNVFALSTYLNREQYGDRPLFYGQTFNSGIVYEVDYAGNPKAVQKEGRTIYGKVVKNSADEPDRYEAIGKKTEYVMTPELDMLFPRMYSGSHAAAYRDWTGMKGKQIPVTTYIDENGNSLSTGETKIKPTFAENLRFFFTYQLNHMYWRYFMWNFAGRQNDIQGNGEVSHGNWISGIPFIDTPRLGDQSLLPDDLGAGNKGHNVFYMLPLLLGIIGLLWQAFVSKRGIEQFWVVFFLFFMTGIAIVLYLNQTPTQPRERDYAFAGSFYAFAIWVGMGVAGLWHVIRYLATDKDSKNKKGTTFDPTNDDSNVKMSKIAAAVACAVGLIVPLQMVSQTWDDHDRSGRYTARDFGMNYLSSLDKNAIIFTNGDNDTFPLWYAQEVEGYRTDVRVVNLSYLNTDWYVNQMKHPTYDAGAIDMMATPDVYAHDKRQYSYYLTPDSTKVNAISALKKAYAPDAANNAWGLYEFRYPNMYIPVDKDVVIDAGRVAPSDSAAISEIIDVNLSGRSGLSLSEVVSLDMIATNANNGWKRPIYFAMTVPDSYYLNLSPYMRNTGMAYEVSPIFNKDFDGYTMAVNTDKAYDNIVNNFRWGGLDSNSDIYLDETVRRMVTTTRSTMLDLATALFNEGIMALAMVKEDGNNADNEKLQAYSNDRLNKALTILRLIEEKLPKNVSPYSIQMPLNIGELYFNIGELTGDEQLCDHGLSIIEKDAFRNAQYVKYFQSLSPSQYMTLPRTLRFIRDTYFVQLIQAYTEYGGDGENLLNQLQASGVNLNEYLNTQE